jgi:hypothetical protein
MSPSAARATVREAGAGFSRGEATLLMVGAVLRVRGDFAGLSRKPAHLALEVARIGAAERAARVVLLQLGGDGVHPVVVASAQGRAWGPSRAAEDRDGQRQSAEQVCGPKRASRARYRDACPGNAYPPRAGGTSRVRSHDATRRSEPSAIVAETRCCAALKSREEAFHGPVCLDRSRPLDKGRGGSGGRGQ